MLQEKTKLCRIPFDFGPVCQTGVHVHFEQVNHAIVNKDALYNWYAEMHWSVAVIDWKI